MLAVQKRAGNIQAQIIALGTEFDSLIFAARSDVRVRISPPMFSSRYLSQFSNELWYALQKGLDEISDDMSGVLAKAGFNFDPEASVH